MEDSKNVSIIAKYTRNVTSNTIMKLYEVALPLQWVVTMMNFKIIYSIYMNKYYVLDT